MEILRTAPAAAYAAIGAVSLARPEMVPALFGGKAGTPEARTEIRAVYGGICIAFAASILTGGRDARRALALASAGMATGRAAGALAERRLQPWPTGFFMAVEAALAASLAAADR